MPEQPPSPRWSHHLPVVYLAFGVLWILASDSVVDWMLHDTPGLLVIVSTLKGFAFVVFTALMLAWWWQAEKRYNESLIAAAEARAGFAAERMAWMSRHANDVILLVDGDGRIVDCNERAETTYGYARDELLRLSVKDLRANSDRSAADGQLRRVRQHGSLIFDARHARRDGTEFPVAISSSQIEFQGQQYIQSIVRDQTELVAARRRLERQRDLFEMLSRCNHAVARARSRQEIFDAVVHIAVDKGHFLFAWLAELQPDMSIVKAARSGSDHGYIEQLELTARADDPKGRGPTGRALREGVTIVCNDFMRDSQTVPWHENARRAGVQSSASVPIRTHGKVTAALMLYAGEPGFFDEQIIETLEEVGAELGFGLEALVTRSQLDESRNLLQTIIDASTAPIYAFDLDGRMLMMNNAGAGIIGRPREQLIGLTRPAFLPDDEAESHSSSDLEVIKTGKPVIVEEKFGGGGQERVFLSVKYPLLDLAGRMYGVGGVSTDITALRQAERQITEANTHLEATVQKRTHELSVARDRAEQADRAKTAFLSTISHELRTPLNSIIGFTDVLLQGLSGPLNDEQLRQLAIVHDSSRTLLDLINEMLDLARIEAGRLQLSTETFDLRALLAKRVAALKTQADAKGLQLSLSIGDDVGAINSDAKRVAQIVTNLLSNAVKFTTQGSVSLTAERESAYVAIAVRDTGAGISEQDMAHLFTPFMQGGDTQQRHGEGTGLGLVISRHLARALGGDITATSLPGHGSTFVARLPVDSPAALDSASDSGLYKRITAPAESGS